MASCASYTCGCLCGAEHTAVPDGPPVQFIKPWNGGSEVGSPLAACHTGLTFVKWLGGGHWVQQVNATPQRVEAPDAD